MAGAPELARDDWIDLGIVGDSGVHTLRTQVQRVDESSGRLVVSWPTEQMRLFPLRPGQLVLVEVSRPLDALYTLETLVESASTEEPPTLVLRADRDWNRVQRRQAVRHAVDMRPSRAMRLRGHAEATPLSGLISDLSAGGLRLSTSTELQVGDLLEFVFSTPSGGAELRLKVNVLRAVPPRGGRGVWDYGCQFVEPSATEREQIVQFILAQQGALARERSSA
jgi:c-di-GMP-binding flagellar brake protein YcgR